MFDKSKKITINPEVQTDGFAWAGADEAIGVDGLTCWGYVIYKSKYGEGVALCCNNKTFYRIPSRYLDEFKTIEDKDREFIMAGHPMTVRKHTTKAGNDTVIISIDGMDI